MNQYIDNSKIKLEKVSIVVDSAISLSPAIVKQFKLYVVPMIIVIGGNSYRDGLDLSNSDFYEFQQESTLAPTTSAPSPHAFLEKFHLASKVNNQILCLTVGSRFSSSYNAALKAIELAEIEIPDVSIKLIDTQTAAASEALITLKAARLAKEGLNLDQIVPQILLIVKEVTFLAILDSLFYLHKGGRVPFLSHWLTHKLQIKPIFELIQGKVKILEKPRHFKKAQSRLLKIMKGRVLNREIQCIVTHANSPETATILSESILNQLNCSDLQISACGPVLGAHTGPNFLGVSFYQTANLPDACILLQ